MNQHTCRLCGGFLLSNEDLANFDGPEDTCHVRCIQRIERRRQFFCAYIGPLIAMAIVAMLSFLGSLNWLKRFFGG